MTARVAINGFGRIGRITLRIIAKRGWPLDVVAINDPFLPVETAAHLLRYDTVYGRSPFAVAAEGSVLVVDGRKIPFLAEKEPRNLPWGKHKVDVVIESSGVFTDPQKAEAHLHAGAKRIVLSAPPSGERKGEVLQILWRVNEHQFLEKGKPPIVSAASCTTNSLGPVVKVLHDAFGIEHGFLTTVHGYTADQRLVDAPHKDLARARAAAANIIPTSTGAARSIPTIFPDLAGKMDGIALRVPVPCGSVSDFVARLKKPAGGSDKGAVTAVNAAFADATRGPLGEVMAVTQDRIVSSDVIGEDHSCVVATAYTMALSKSCDVVKVLAFYDNEWGYAARFLDVAKFVTS
ncbi:TPA: type I glyceraldehyde-3-phosphate dehydrogenase [Candidatus Acetothermia bacterium]|nr:type I glyceraldehyde-3-phosphate dehydrogenase [Candidatus Acetothermia bacterium]HAZ30579.1 type I glyceraldehyde-3-phosphate dehydrogenase [Candidatus Acetothermia bacterium]